MSYRSYALTIRPLLGLNDKTEDALIKWIQKLDYAFMAIEKQDEARHAHIQVWFETPKARGDICKQLQRICERTIEEFNEAQKKVLRNGVKIAYSDWYLDYLADNDNKEGEEKGDIVYDKPPQQSLEYYPTEEEQENVMKMKNAIDPRFAKLEIQFHEWLPEGGTTNRISVASFLAWAMFDARIIQVKVNSRDRIALAESLFLYVTKSNNEDAFLPNHLCKPSIIVDKYDDTMVDLTPNLINI